MRDAEKTVGNMIDKEKTIFVGSVDAEGFPNIKAMLQTRKREGIKHIYLSTNTSSMRVSQFLKNNRACLYVCNTRFFKGVMLRGTMEILTDSTSKEMIWQEGDTMYYPEGVTDPDYCVLKFIIRKTKCFDFWERNVLFPKTKRSFFRTPTLPFSA